MVGTSVEALPFAAAGASVHGRTREGSQASTRPARLVKLGTAARRTVEALLPIVRACSDAVVPQTKSTRNPFNEEHSLVQEMSDESIQHSNERKFQRQPLGPKPFQDAKSHLAALQG